MFSPEIKMCLQEFSKNLNSVLPLRHHCEYMDANKMNCAIQAEKDKAIQNFRKTVLIHKIGEEKREFAEKFRSELETLVREHQKKNEEFKIRAHSILKKRVEGLCADFKCSAETKLLLNQGMDLESLEEFLEIGKKLANKYFNYHSNYGSDGLYHMEQMNQEELLVQESEKIRNVILKQRRCNVKVESISDGERRNLLQEKTHFQLKKLFEDLCSDFKSTSETKLMFKSDMDLESLTDLTQTGIELAKRYFEHHSNFGNVGLYNAEEQLLEQELKKLATILRKEQRRNLKLISDLKTKTLLGKLHATVLEMSEKVKADSCQWNVSQRKLKQKVQEIYTHIVEYGFSVLSDGSSREIYSELLKLECGENMSPEEFIKWSEGLRKEVKFEIECEKWETSETDILLEEDTEDDALEVDGNNMGLGIKKEVVEMENESSDFETLTEIDVDIKVELGGLVLQKSCMKQKSHLLVEPSHYLHKTEKDENHCYAVSPPLPSTKRSRGRPKKGEQGQKQPRISTRPEPECLAKSREKKKERKERMRKQLAKIKAHRKLPN